MYSTSDDIAARERGDIQFLLGVIVGVVVSFIASLVSMLLMVEATFNDLLINFLTLLIGFMFLVGLLIIWDHRSKGVVPMRRAVLIILVCAVLLAFGFAISPFADQIDIVIGRLDIDLGGLGAMRPLASFIAMSILDVVLLSMLYVVGFGINAIIASIQRLTIPYVKGSIEGMAMDDSDSGVHKLIAWLFDVPSVIEIDRIVYNRPGVRGSLPREEMRSAFIWVSIFAAVIAVYISLNPLILINDMPVEQTIPLAAAAVVFVPLAILPWFGYKAMGMRFPSRPKDYLLYEGMKRKMTGLVAVSTAALFLLMGIQYFDPAEMWRPLTFYLLFDVAVGVMFVFIYFNNIEPDLMEFLQAKMDMDDRSIPGDVDQR